jgi:hypothetical protein
LVAADLVQGRILFRMSAAEDIRPSSPSVSPSIEPPPPLGAVGVAFACVDTAEVPPAFTAATSK